MKLTRRQFAILAAAIVAGCGREKTKIAATTAPTNHPSTAPGVIDAGPISKFASDAVDATFRDQGFFIINREERLFALSSICTHKGCKVRSASDQSFYCKCHGSTFDRDGHVTKGPATRDLPRLAVALDNRKHLLVDPARPLTVPGLGAKSFRVLDESG